MICKRIEPATVLAPFIREYVLLHTIFDINNRVPVKSYPVNPEEGIIFLLRGSLIAESPEIGKTQQRPKVFLFGLPESRQNLHISEEYMMLCVRFRPGVLCRLTGIPMTELKHQYIDAELILGPEIRRLWEQLANAVDYANILRVTEDYFRYKMYKLQVNQQPLDSIGGLILAHPQAFNLNKIAGQACLSPRQFEKRFLRQIGVSPKHFARICRFYQAYILKEYHPTRSWFDIAVQTGYNDYQHLVKDFKQFAGVLPPVFMQECAQNPERLLPVATDFRGA